MSEHMPEMKTEPVTKEQVRHLQNAAGLGAMLVSWDIDYEVGRGVLEGNSRCLWSKDGRRITAIWDRGVFVLSQADEQDPIYVQLRTAALALVEKETT